MIASSLPSGFFYKSFVDQYARALSLDTQEIDAEVDRVLSADAPLPLPGFESVVARNVPPLTFAPRFHSRRTLRSGGHFDIGARRMLGNLFSGTQWQLSVQRADGDR